MTLEKDQPTFREYEQGGIGLVNLGMIDIRNSENSEILSKLLWMASWRSYCRRFSPWLSRADARKMGRNSNETQRGRGHRGNRGE